MMVFYFKILILIEGEPATVTSIPNFEPGYKALTKKGEFYVASRFESFFKKLVLVAHVNSFDLRNLQSNHSTFQHYHSLVSKPIFASLT